MAEQRKKLGIPVDVARQQLVDDEDTRAIAENLGMELEEYIDLVLDFALHPEKEPMLEIIPEEDLAEMGADVASAGEVSAWFKAVETGEIELRLQADKVRDDLDRDNERARQEKLRQAVGGGTPVLAQNVSVAPRGATKRKSEKREDSVGKVLRQQLQGSRLATQQKRPARAGAPRATPTGPRSGAKKKTQQKPKGRR